MQVVSSFRFFHACLATQAGPRSRARTRAVARTVVLALLVGYGALASPSVAGADRPSASAHSGPSQQLPPATEDPDLKAAYAYYQRGAVSSAFERYARAAKRGQPIAQYNIAMMLFNGEGVAMDPARARDWLARAAAGGLAQAQFNQGLLYENGNGVARSQSEAAAWFRRAAEQGHADAQVSLATQYFLGRGVKKDEAEAARWYKRAAIGGVVEAQYIIASCYEHGEGVARDKKRAIYWYTKAGLQGDTVAAEKAKVLSAPEKTSRKIVPAG